MRSRRKFSPELKREAVELASQLGQTVAQVARDLGIRANMLSRWKRKAAAHGGKAFVGQGVARDEELMRLRRELAQVKREREFFKKRGDLLRQGNQVKFECIVDHRDVLPVAMMCRLLEVKRSGFYAWLRRPPSKRSQDDQRYKKKVVEIYEESDGVYGSRKVRNEFLDLGFRSGRRKVSG